MVVAVTVERPRPVAVAEAPRVELEPAVLEPAVLEPAVLEPAVRERAALERAALETAVLERGARERAAWERAAPGPRVLAETTTSAEAAEPVAPTRRAAWVAEALRARGAIPKRMPVRAAAGGRNARCENHHEHDLSQSFVVVLRRADR